MVDASTAADAGEGGAVDAGTAADTGTGGAVDAGTAADTGTGGAGGAGGTGGAAGSDGLIRGPAPTQQSASADGPYDVGTITDFRDGPDFGGGTIWYPTDADPPFAAVAICPGWNSYESSIDAWGPFLASHGIVTITIETNTLSEFPDSRADALMDALASVAAEDTRSGSPLNGTIETSRFAVMGWSMGGGGSLIAAENNPDLKAGVSLCGWEPNTSFNTNTVPHLLFGGESDGTANPNSNAIVHYESIPDTTPKMYFEVAGGSHSIANDPDNEGGEVGRYGLSWLKVFLEGDERYRQFLLETPSSSSDFRSSL